MNPEPGAPIDTSPPIPSEVLAVTPDFEDGDGFQLVIAANTLVITVRITGQEAEVGIPIESLLDAIGKYNHKTGS